MGAPRLDIFEALRAVDGRDFEWFAQQPEELRRTLAPPVFLRWASAVTPADENMLSKVHERLNRDLWTLMKFDPDLVFRLAASCGTGRRQRHEWIAMPRGQRQANLAYEFLAKAHPTLKADDLDRLLKLHTRETFSDLLNECGCQADDAKAILSSFDKLGTVPGEPVAKPRRKRS